MPHACGSQVRQAGTNGQLEQPLRRRQQFRFRKGGCGEQNTKGPLGLNKGP